MSDHNVHWGKGITCQPEVFSKTSTSSCTCAFCMTKDEDFLIDQRWRLNETSPTPLSCWCSCSFLANNRSEDTPKWMWNWVIWNDDDDIRIRITVLHFLLTVCCRALACSSCSYLLSSVLRLKVMGLSDSVLSCLPFIAGLLYLIDPLCVYTCTHTYTYACMSTERGMLQLCMCVWPWASL